MNFWTQQSITLASQGNYLDELFKVYPIDQEKIRELDKGAWAEVVNAFEKSKRSFGKKDNEALIRALLKLPLFPIKDSYVAYLRHDPTSIKRNPKTVNRLCGALLELGLKKIAERCSAPKEPNRQIGALFRNFLRKKTLGFPVLCLSEFEKTKKDAILDASDGEAQKYCAETARFTREKGLDFVAKVNKKIVLGEAKFLTDFGGHQNAQLEDALLTLESPVKKGVVKIVIADGVCYIPGENKLYTKITGANANIMSALFLLDFLHTL